MGLNHLKTVMVPGISSIFQEAQVEQSSHSQLVASMSRLFNETNIEAFSFSFNTCLKIIMIAKADTRYSADRALDFAAQFVVSVLGLNLANEENRSPKAEHFWQQLFSFLKKNHSRTDILIRKRICSFIAKFMCTMSLEAELDCEICDIIIDIMSERIKDRVPIVRLQALLAIFRLQDTSNVYCPVIKMLLNCIETDNCADVRKLALTKISLKHKVIVRQLINRVDDASEKVRKDVYRVFSKLPPIYFNAEERKRILHTGLYDISESVRRFVQSYLLPAWLKRLDNDYMKFLQLFDLIVDSPELITKALMSLFENMEEEYNCRTIKNLLDELHLISHDKLSCENAFYWRSYIYYSSKMIDEKTHYQWRPEKSYDAAGDGLLPDLSVFCEYIKTYYETVVTQSNTEGKWKRKEQEFIFIQFLELCKVYDYSDEVGRKALQTLCLNLLKEVHIQTISPLIQLFFMLRTNLNQSICLMTNEINNLLHPIEGKIQGKTYENSYKELSKEVDLTPEEENRLRFKIAQLEVHLEELLDFQEEAVKSEDFSKAQELKIKIGEIRNQINMAKESLFRCRTSPYNRAEDGDLLLEDDDNEEDLQNPLDNVDSEVILRCLTTLYEMMQLCFLKTLIPELRILFQDLVLYACKSNDHVIAPLGIELLGAFCLRDKDLAEEYFITFFSLLGNSYICVSALKVIFELVLCFGPSTFNIDALYDGDNEKDKDNSEVFSHSESGSSSYNSALEEQEEPQCAISGYAFISVLIDLLDDEFVEARYTVVRGMCRLMALGKLKSAKVLSRLIILWFHPSSHTRQAVDIRNCLNFFFPYFLKSFKWALPLFDEAFIPTMGTLFNAPRHSPISEIDQRGVIKVLCEITNPSFVNGDNDKISNNENIHGNFAVSICKTIIELDDQEKQAVLLKGLDFLNLSINASTISTLNKLISKIISVFKKENNRKMVSDAEKFKIKLNAQTEQGHTLEPEVNTNEDESLGKL